MSKKTWAIIISATVIVTLFAFGGMWVTRPASNSYALQVLEDAKGRQDQSIISVSPMETDTDKMSDEDKMAEKVAYILKNDETFVSSLESSGDALEESKAYTDEKLAELMDEIKTLLGVEAAPVAEPVVEPAPVVEPEPEPVVEYTADGLPIIRRPESVKRPEDKPVPAEPEVAVVEEPAPVDDVERTADGLPIIRYPESVERGAKSKKPVPAAPSGVVATETVTEVVAETAPAADADVTADGLPIIRRPEPAPAPAPVAEPEPLPETTPEGLPIIRRPESAPAPASVVEPEPVAEVVEPAPVVEEPAPVVETTPEGLPIIRRPVIERRVSPLSAPEFDAPLENPSEAEIVDARNSARDAEIERVMNFIGL